MPQQPAKSKLRAVREVIVRGKSLKEISSQYSVSRQTLASWIKKYQKSPSRGAGALETLHRRGRKHHRRLSTIIERLTLDLVVKNPDYSVLRLKEKVAERGYKVSAHGIYNVLLRYQLQTRQLRHRFALVHPVKTLLTSALAPAHRAKIVEEYLEEGKSIAKICRMWHIGRPTFYAWLRRYQEALVPTPGVEEAYTPGVSSRTVEALVRRYKKGHGHHRSAGREIEELILSMVRQNPYLSVHKIYQLLLGEAVRVGHHAVQNVLERLALNTVEKRLAWAQAQVPIEEPEPVAAPVLPRNRLLRLLAHFATIPKLMANNPITWPFVLPPLLFAAYIFELDKAFRPTIFFPIVALSFGLIFFFYSMKYYISLVLVLKLGGGANEKEKEAKADNQLAMLSAKVGQFLGRFFKKPPESESLGLVEDLSSVKLTSRPFVSIHVPLYNEKRVVERMIRACTSQEWAYTPGVNELHTGSGSRGGERMVANYELIIVDDSTDETTSIAKQSLIDGGWQLRKTNDERPTTKVQPKDDTGSSLSDPVSEEKGIEIFTATKPNGPTVKLIHRSSRAGFKGAALEVARKNTDPRAKYILVFDADFVPYPDTIEQFVKYFALAQSTPISAESGKGHSRSVPQAQLHSGSGGIAGADERGFSGNQRGSKIAAVQGYQWHVLNKSENWITRGVRSEYAGSYVVERSAIELYGGLKMIAGSVYAIRRDILDKFGWGTSITEDFELTLRLYEKGYKVLYTPYIQAPAEAVSTIRRLIRQRMRWAEGHSFNIRHQIKSIAASKHLSWREKFEFAYLAPYYLQAAFFVVGTFAWFISEVIFKVSLPYWTAALGWSLVFVNFLALPLINLLGLFLEQSEEKDYLGVASFVLLAYIVTPFQAYAAIKGFLEKEEGPWFRTPKTGKITDVIGRVRIGHWEFKWPFRPATVPVASQIAAESGKGHSRSVPQAQLHSGSGGIAGADERGFGVNPRLALASAFNPLTGYNIKPRRISFVSRSVIAGLLVVVMFINYLAFFAEPKPAEAVGTPRIEQQINFINQESTTTSTTFVPTDNSLGIIRWQAGKWSNISAVYFEAVINNNTSGSTTTAALFQCSNASCDTATEITEGTDCQVSTTSTSYTRVRATQNFTTCPNYVADSWYTVRIKASANTARIQAARLIILQVGQLDQSISGTQTQVEVGGKDSANSTTYQVMEDPKFYCYDVTQTGTTCDTAASPSRWNPAPTIYFEATLSTSPSATNVDAALFTTGGSEVSGSSVRGTSTTYTLVRSGVISLTAGTEYQLRRRAQSGGVGTVVNAKIILEQQADQGISALETMQHYNTREFLCGDAPTTCTAAAPLDLEYDNQYNDDNFGTASLAAYFESMLRTEATDVNLTAHGAICKVLGSCGTAGNRVGEVTRSNTTADRVRSTDIKADLPTAATDIGAILWCTSDSGCDANNKDAFIDASSWLIIQISSIPVPEVAILALPGILFLPKIVAWIKQKRKGKKKKTVGGGRDKNKH